MTDSSAAVPAAEALIEALGADRVITDPREVGLLARDMGEPPETFQRLLGAIPPQLGVRPRGSGEIATAVRVLAGEGVPFTPRGLSSSGLGGAVPVSGGASLDLSHHRGVVDLDVDGARVTVRAGSTFYFLQHALDRHGLVLPCRPTNAFGTVGGWASCGGIGLGSLAAGPLIEQVDEIEVVLPDGTVERLAAGDGGFPDFFDTEGQLGVITELRLRLRRLADGTAVRGWVLPDMADAVSFAEAAIAAEALPRTVMMAGHTRELQGLDGQPAGEVVLIEAEPGHPALRGHGGVPQLAAGPTQKLWDHRYFPMDNPLGPVFLASEVLLPLDTAADFIASARKTAKRYGIPLHGHCYAVVVDEQPRLLVLLMYPTDPRQGWQHLVLTPLAAALTESALRRGGRPYGIGIWNAAFARLRFGDARLGELLRRKQQLDPRGLCNPGKFFRVGQDAAMLSTLMKPGLYAPSLRLATVASPLVVGRRDPSERPATTADRCINCGACVPVCPAVAATGAESVSARAKLALMKRLQAGESAGEEELLGSQRCLECGQCAEVCARSLELVEAWDELEQMVLSRLGERGAFEETIRAFAEAVDAQEDAVLGVALP